MRPTLIVGYWTQVFLSANVVPFFGVSRGVNFFYTFLNEFSHFHHGHPLALVIGYYNNQAILGNRERFPVIM